MKTDFGNRIRKLRNDRKMTQQEVAASLGKSASAVRMWENGSNEPDMGALLRLGELFNCSLDYLLCRDLLGTENGSGKMRAAVFTLSEYIPGAAADRFSPLPTRFCSDGNEYLFVRADSDDMSPVIQNGDEVLVRLQDSCMNGQLVLAGTEQTGTVFRKLLFQDGGIVLQPFNAMCDAVFIPFDDEQPDRLRIYGVAVELIKDFL